jgi:hypothetical protein
MTNLTRLAIAFILFASLLNFNAIRQLHHDFWSLTASMLDSSGMLSGASNEESSATGSMVDHVTYVLKEDEDGSTPARTTEVTVTTSIVAKTFTGKESGSVRGSSDGIEITKNQSDNDESSNRQSDEEVDVEGEEDGDEEELDVESMEVHKVDIKAFLEELALEKDSYRNLGDSKIPVIDILSTGSLGRQELQMTQEAIFTAHPSVRHYFKTSEDDDPFPACHQNLTLQHMDRFIKFCHSSPRRFKQWKYYFLKVNAKAIGNRGWIMRKKNPVGWLCAQQRPAVGLEMALKSYQHNRTLMPDYFIFVDDDTWIHFDPLIETLNREAPPEKPYYITGCTHRHYLREQWYNRAYGGFSITLTRKLLELITQPLYCEFRQPNASESYYNYKNEKTTTNWFHNHRFPFKSRRMFANASSYDEKTNIEMMQYMCWRLEKDGIGERSLFSPGMSLSDLMYAYATRFSYLNVENWKHRDVGYCFLGHGINAYWFNMYLYDPIAMSGKKINQYESQTTLLDYQNGTLRIDDKIPNGTKIDNECYHDSADLCMMNATFCHYMTAEKMIELHRNFTLLAKGEYQQE